LQKVDVSFAIQTLDAVIQAGECVARGDLAVSGKDILLWGVERGDAVGVVLETLLDAVMEDRCENTAQALKAYYNEHIKNG